MNARRAKIPSVYRLVAVLVAPLAVAALWVSGCGSTGDPFWDYPNCTHTRECPAKWDTCLNDECTCPTDLIHCCPNGGFNCKVEQLECLTAAECYPTTGVDAGTDAPTGPIPCTTVSDCPAPAEPKCAEAQCVNGQCSLNVFEGKKLDSQVGGDCKTMYCSILGELKAIEDPSDIPVDGNPCTVDLCMDGVPMRKPLDLIPCPGAKGYCVTGKCVGCDEPLHLYCDGQLACYGSYCVPGYCQNFQLDNGLETDVDCGGSVCVPCLPGDTCKVASDCMSKVCLNGICQAPSTMDGVQNGSETGVDCGCIGCVTLCKDGEACDGDADCASGVCFGSICQAPSCTDGIKNGSEQGIDCGGSCPAC